MSYSAIIARLVNVRAHPDADRLKLATVCGNQVIVGIDSEEGEVGIYFPSDGQLSEAYASSNDLVRRKDAEGNNIGGMFCEKRRVRMMKLRGEFSDGYFAPLSSLKGSEKLPVGYEFTALNGIEVCNKYIIHAPSDFKNKKGGQSKKYGIRCEDFKPHFDTTQLGRAIEKLSEGDNIIITDKMHGTSSRVCNLPVNIKYGWFKRLISKIFRLNLQATEYRTLLGTRRVIKGFYEDMREDWFRTRATSNFATELHQGETIYGEIVGWEHNNKTIMPSISKKKLGKGLRRYVNHDDVMVYKYNVPAGECEHFVYRITQTDPRGNITELSWDQVKKRCHELGIQYVPEIASLIYNGDEDTFLAYCDELRQGDDYFDESHIREGVVIRAENDRGMICLKHKNNDFKLLEDGSKADGVVDPEDEA